MFEILSGRFRHKKIRFGLAFDAVCALCQYKMENETPLFDILIEDVVDASTEDDDSCDYSLLEADDDTDDEDGKNDAGDTEERND